MPRAGSVLNFRFRHRGELRCDVRWFETADCRLIVFAGALVQVRKPGYGERFWPRQGNRKSCLSKLEISCKFVYRVLLRMFPTRS